MDNTDACFERAQRGELLSESDIRHLCEKAKEILIKQENIVQVSRPAVIFGDIHGQFSDLIEALNMAAMTFNVKDGASYVFLGDYVDRGAWSVKTMCMLLAYLVRHPHNCFLLRGNHETRTISQVFGFYDECLVMFGSNAVWKEMMLVFELLPLAACVDGGYYCVHGGLSRKYSTLDSIRTVDRNCEPPTKGTENEPSTWADLLWSDPNDESPQTDWKLSERGSGWVFGDSAVDEFLHQNKQQYIIRSHQLAQDGFFFHLSRGRVVTVWSAPDYTYTQGNAASVLAITPVAVALQRGDFLGFEASARHAEEREEMRLRKSACMEYFV